MRTNGRIRNQRTREFKGKTTMRKAHLEQGMLVSRKSDNNIYYEIQNLIRTVIFIH